MKYRRHVLIVTVGAVMLAASGWFLQSRRAREHRVVAVGWMGDVRCFSSCEITQGSAVVDGSRETDPVFGCLHSGRFHAAAAGVSSIHCDDGTTVEMVVRGPSRIDLQFPREMTVGQVDIPKVRAFDSAGTELDLGTARLYADIVVSGAVARQSPNDMDFLTRGVRVAATREGEGRVEATFDEMSFAMNIIVHRARDAAPE